VRSEALWRQACRLRVADDTSVSLAPTAFPHRAWLVAPQSVALPVQFSQTHTW